MVLRRICGFVLLLGALQTGAFGQSDEETILHIFEKFQQKIKNKDFSDIYNVLGPILELATKTATKTLKSTKNMMATKF